MKTADVIVIGAGAAGMMCAAHSAAHGLSVRLIDHAQKLGEKIRISGGGRCNFTNLGATWENYLSLNSRFAHYALKKYTPQDFLALLEKHQITWHEKHRGQLFCDRSSNDIIHMLYKECQRGQVKWHMPCHIERLDKHADGFVLQTSDGVMKSSRLVMATGGMAAPAIGATDFGLRIARQFGLKVVEPFPALVPLVFDGVMWEPYKTLAGIAVESYVANGRDKKAISFLEDILFTHRGLSGPGILQISSYWHTTQPIYINLCPATDIEAFLVREKAGSKQSLLSVMSHYLPKRLAQHILSSAHVSEQQKWAELPDKTLRQIAHRIQHWELFPKMTAGYKKAEAMKGGVSTAELDPQTMQSKKIEGLYFIGEVVDITGWLGGYNFQWAWSSGVVCANACGAAC